MDGDASRPQGPGPPVSKPAKAIPETTLRDSPPAEGTEGCTSQQIGSGPPIEEIKAAGRELRAKQRLVAARRAARWIP